MDQLAAAAQKCVDGRCDVYERDAVIKNMLETRKDMRSEMAKINIFLKEIGYIDDENDIVNFTLKGALRALFGRSKNEPPAANTDGYATGFSGDVTPTKDFFRWDWHWKNPSFTRSD
uniref:Uncharacterized protein n=2 Tax=Phaeomonas parva TaxID=124430 RepID=A0A7S1XLT2_9STRA|mmetsp:Transcript_15924/g.48603  ORF Transcript_15924/g.48603 Transcript_15924/m.48603 type:complete len:117 (+) Transcript_15924:438-788(+)